MRSMVVGHVEPLETLAGVMKASACPTTTLRVVPLPVPGRI